MGDATSYDLINKNINSFRKNLLDMGMRNNLLNFKELARTISIFREDIGELYNILVFNEDSMGFLPLNEEESLDVSVNHEWIMPDTNNVPASHTDLFLQTKFNDDELRKRLNSLYQHCKTSMEEQGYNSLFLALGFLKWKESDNELDFHKAPLILIPVELSRESISKPFEIKYNLEDVRPNISLKHKLNDQGIELPIFDVDFESKDDVYSYLNEVKEVIKFKSDWSIINDIYLSTFSFKKFVMYQDLNLENWADNIYNEGLKDLFNPSEDEKHDSFNEEDVDDFVHSEDVFHVMDADSSQIAVLEEVKRGKNLVVEGPPGTGKSQTIVNLIAELLANNQTVLFVSEKMAALEVVKKRLDTIGLSDGCLELHSNKAKKKDVLEELNRTLQKDCYELKETIDFDKFEDMKQNLNQYMEDINHVYGGTGSNTFELYGICELNQQFIEENSQELYKFDMGNLKNHDLEKFVNNIEEIVQIYDKIKPSQQNPWKDTTPSNLMPQDMETVENNLKNNVEELKSLINTKNNISDSVGCKNFEVLDNINEYIKNFDNLEPNIKLLKDKNEIDVLINSIEEFQSRTKNLDLNILDLDLENKEQEVISLSKDINSLNLNEDILNINLESSINDFKKYKSNIANSKLENALKDNELENKLQIFKKEKDSFILKRAFNKDFKNARDSLKSYYNEDVSNDQIINDFTELISWNKDLSNLRDKILAYCKDKESDEKIIFESGKLLELADELNQIQNEIAKFIQKRDYKNSKSIKNEISNLIELKNLKLFIESKDTIGKYYFNNIWKGYETDILSLKEKLNILIKFKELYDNEFFSDKTITFLEDNPNLNDLNFKLRNLKNNYVNIVNNFQSLDNLLQFNGAITIDNFNKINIVNLLDFNKNLLKNFDGLNNFRKYKNIIDKNENTVTKEFFKILDEDKIKTNCIIPLFKYNFANNCLKDILNQNPSLYNFDINYHIKKIDKFKEIDLKILKFNKYRVQEILENKRPSIEGSINSKSQLGKLQHEISKKRRILPIRKIFSECKDTLIKIKPCFMMSPISIAQFLNPKDYEGFFDYVIFDEASQIKIEDALGAMIRGKHYVIMGDTKQLPPTSFFNSETVNYDEDEDLYADEESILHRCNISFPHKMLKWHYRSKHESLIAVSNKEFYNNKLYIYPSPMIDSEDLGLKFEYHSDTEYDRGGSSKNIKEAEYVIDYVIKHFQKYGGKKSVGIATFSTKQQQAIFDMLELKIKEYPELEKYFNDSGENGFFIKNLENIQGDERDIIIISIGYGFTAQPEHKLYGSFGPLNKEGGERRLNVLTTRAREKCVIFSNFKSGDLHLTSESPRGVKALQEFLYYAENNEFSLNTQTGDEFDSPFEESVYNFLDRNGYQVENQIGCAGYKIDLAIVDPDDSNRYVLGIECDGASYHSSSVARDRDRLRQQILEKLGWKFHRIWSTDWYNNRNNAKKELIKKVEEALENKNDKIVKKEETSTFIPEMEKIKKEDKVKSEFVDYNYTNIIRGTDFYSNSTSSLNTIILQIVDNESPIHLDEIYERVKQIFDQKNTQKFRRTLNPIINSLVNSGNITRKGDFFYSKTNTNIQARKRIHPKIDRISDEEIEDSINKVLKTQDLPLKELPKEASKYLGFNLLQKPVKEKYVNIINQMIEKGKINS